MEENLISKIENGPMVLLLGQKYLSLTNNEDILLTKCVNKFQTSILDKTNNYNDLFNLNLDKDYEAASTWIENLCKNISVPLWLDRIARIAWSSVYTSAIDTVIQRAFLSEWRKVQPVYDENFRVIDPRNKFNLHLTYLFGCISQIDPAKRPPLSLLEKSSRKATSNQFLQRLPELITTNGALIIDAYDIDDWLSVEELYATLSKMAVEQTFLFSCSDALYQDEHIRDLISKRKIIVFKENFAQILTEFETTGRIKLSTPDPENYLGKWISIGNRKIKLPQELINKVSKTAIILDESLFYTKSFRNDDEKYLEFKHFLSGSFSSNWEGYAYDFAFKRDYFSILKEKVLDKTLSQKEKDVPVILYGQSSSGKTVSLKQLAYELSQQNKFPVLFIEKRYQKIDETDIDRFCQWAEENDATSTIVIWDGMVEADLYFNLLRKLNARGRNIVLVGSTYDQSISHSQKNIFIKSPIELSTNEKEKFIQYLEKIDYLLSGLINDLYESNLLAMFYRHLPVTRSQIKKGLKSEFDYFSKILREAKETPSASKKGSMFAALEKAGLIDDTEIAPLDSIKVIDGEEINISDLIIFSVMVPGQFALNVPYEILLRAIGFESLSSNLFKALSNIDLILWSEGSQGNILLGPRTAVEAEILTKYLGSKKAQIEYIKILLNQVRGNGFSDFVYESNPEINFAVDLLNSIGPNNTKQNYLEYLYEITNVLKELRESRQAYHPRLVLKEASFLRKLAKEKGVNVNESKTALFERAELIVRDALEQLKNFQERTITNYLRGELATILGYKAYEYSDEGNDPEAKECYELVKEINNFAFSSNPENYPTLDVLAWTTDKLIRSNSFTETEKYDAVADLSNQFDMAEIEGISEQNQEDFYKRKLQVYESLGNSKVADSAFDKLLSKGFTSGYYIRAKRMLNRLDFNQKLISEEFVKGNEEAFAYLSSVFDEIKGDGRCIFLTLKTWWVARTKTQLFADEKRALPFNRTDWEFCNSLVELLLSKEEIYQSTITYYLKAISEFHLNRIRDSVETFRTLDSESDFSSYGRRRVIRSYLASTSDGKPRVFSGEVKRSVSSLKKEKSGQLYVSEIREFIPFILTEFGKTEYQEGEKIANFYIGFNFRGPIATAIKY